MSACQVYLIECVLIKYQVDLTGRPFQSYLSGLPDSERLVLGDEYFEVIK
jgi:hypothetical protein